MNQTESIQTIGFLPNDNNEIIFPLPIKSSFKTLSFSFRTYSNISTIIQFEEIHLNIDIDGYLTLVIGNRQVQKIFSNEQQKPMNDGIFYFVQIEFHNQTLEISIDKTKKFSIKLLSSFLIIENLIFGLNNQFLGCIKNLTYNNQILSFEHLSLNRRQCPIKSKNHISIHQIISFKENDRPLIIQLNNSEEFEIFSFLFSTQESNCIIGSLTDQIYENILILSIHYEQLLLTYYNNKQKKRIEILMNYLINSRNEHQIIIKLINKYNLVFQFDENIIIKNITNQFYINQISIGKLNEVIQKDFSDLNNENFIGCIKDLRLNNKSLIKFEHIDQLDRLTNTCQLMKRERK